MSKPADVAILVPHHLNEMQPYLDACLRCALRQTAVDFTVTVIADTPNPPVVPEGVRLVHERALDTFAKKLNWGMRNVPAKAWLLLSDDVLLGQDALASMLRAAKEWGALVNPDSNMEDIAIAREQWWFGGNDAHSRDSAEEHVCQSARFLGQPSVHARRLSFYCTLIPAAVVERVGYLDDEFVNGWEDTDYCVRARKAGVNLLVAQSAIAYHFGSKTIGRTVTPQAKANADRYWHKWHNEPLAYLALP